MGKLEFIRLQCDIKSLFFFFSTQIKPLQKRKHFRKDHQKLQWTELEEERMTKTSQRLNQNQSRTCQTLVSNSRHIHQNQSSSSQPSLMFKIYDSHPYNEAHLTFHFLFINQADIVFVSAVCYWEGGLVLPGGYEQLPHCWKCRSMKYADSRLHWLFLGLLRRAE